MHGFLVAGLLCRTWPERSAWSRVVQLGEAVGDLAPADEELEAVGDVRVIVVAPRQRRDFRRISMMKVGCNSRCSTVSSNSVDCSLPSPSAWASYARVPAACAAGNSRSSTSRVARSSGLNCSIASRTRQARRRAGPSRCSRPDTSIRGAPSTFSAMLAQHIFGRNPSGRGSPHRPRRTPAW